MLFLYSFCGVYIYASLYSFCGVYIYAFFLFMYTGILIHTYSHRSVLVLKFILIDMLKYILIDILIYIHIYKCIYSYVGTPEYLAPELLENTGHGKAVDWWALGTLLHEMICGRPPYYDTNVQRMYHKILHEPLRFPKV